MSKFFIEEDGKITNILEAETLEIAEAVSGGKAHSFEDAPAEGLDIGWYIAESGAWTAPALRI